jgi:hypothetical protein
MLARLFYLKRIDYPILFVMLLHFGLFNGIGQVSTKRPTRLPKVSFDVPLPELKQKTNIEGNNVGQYKQIIGAANTIISPGDSIIIKQFFSGYGNINLQYNKMYFLPSSDILENTSYVTSGLSIDEKKNLNWGGKIDTISYNGGIVKIIDAFLVDLSFSLDTVRLKFLKDSLNIRHFDNNEALITIDSLGIAKVSDLLLVNNFDTYTIFDDKKVNDNRGTVELAKKPSFFSNDTKISSPPLASKSIMINSEASFFIDSAPLIWKLKTKEDTKPGKYKLNFVWTYYNGNEWVVDNEEIEITVMNWYQRYDKEIQLFSYVIAAMTFLSLVKPTLNFFNPLWKILRRFLKWSRKRIKIRLKKK